MADAPPFPDVVTTIYDRSSGARFDVLAFRKLSPSEVKLAARHFVAEQRRGRRSWKPKRGARYRVVTVIR